MRFSLFADSVLFHLTQSANFTWFKGTGDLDAKGFSGGMDDVSELSL